MAAASHVTAWIYGEVQGSDPGLPDGYSRYINYSTGQVKSFPTAGTVFHPLSPAVTMGGVACNAYIEVLPSGLSKWARRYATDSSVSTLATAAG